MVHFIKHEVEGEAALRCLVETCPHGVAVLDLGSRVLAFNELLRDLLGLASEPGRRIIKADELLADASPEEGLPAVMTKLRAGEEVLFTSARGIPLAARAKTGTDGRLVVLFALQTLQNGTNPLGEGAIRESDCLLFDTLEALQDGVAVTDADDRIILVNKRLREIFAQSGCANVLNRNLRDVMRTIFPDETDYSIREIVEPVNTWCERRFPNGLWYEITRVRASDGALISLYTDVSHFKRQSAELHQRTGELIKLLLHERQMVRVQRDFVSLASHEFRTPLAVIDSSAQRLLRRLDHLTSEDVSERMQRIRTSVDRIGAMIERFLNAEQMQSDGLTLDLEEGNFREAVKAVCRHFSDACLSHQILVDVNDLPERLRFDENLFEQCLSNLLSNAVKYSPDADHVQVVGRCGDAGVEISVIDMGIGIPKEEHNRIFDRFCRGAMTGSIGGAGIGLNFAQMIAERHGGNITVDSEPGKGACFTIHLPFETSRTDPAHSAETSRPMPQPTPPTVMEARAQ